MQSQNSLSYKIKSPSSFPDVEPALSPNGKRSPEFTSTQPKTVGRASCSDGDLCLKNKRKRTKKILNNEALLTKRMPQAFSEEEKKSKSCV